MSVFRVHGHYNDMLEGDSLAELDALVTESSKTDFGYGGYLISESLDTPNGFSDDEIFFYGIPENELIGDHGDFTITSYELYEETT